MFAIDGTLFVIFFSFLIFMLILKGLFFEPVAKIKQTRKSAVETATAEAHSASENRTQAAQTYAARIQEAQKQALQSVQAKREEARHKAAERVAEARTEALTRVDAQTQALRNSQEAAYGALADEKESFIHAIVAKLSAGQVPVSAGAPHSTSVS